MNITELVKHIILLPFAVLSIISITHVHVQETRDNMYTCRKQTCKFKCSNQVENHTKQNLNTFHLFFSNVIVKCIFVLYNCTLHVTIPLLYKTKVFRAPFSYPHMYVYFMAEPVCVCSELHISVNIGNKFIKAKQFFYSSTTLLGCYNTISIGIL